MKYIVILFILLLGMSTICFARDLIKAEELTNIEKMEIKIAKDKVIKAKNELTKLKERIAASHSMRKEEYMEWSSNYEIEGDYILFYKMEVEFVGTPNSIKD